MSLFAYNLTTSPLALAAGVPIVTLPSSTSAGARGTAMDVTAELNSLTAPAFALLQAQVAAGQVQYEWTGLPEFNTYTLVVGSAQADVDDVDVMIYVDPVSGNDSNPGTASLPVLTLNRALELKPIFWKRRCRINLVAGNYPFLATGSLTVGPNFFNINGAVGPFATPLAILGTAIDAAAPGGKPLTALVADVTSTSTSYVADISALVGTNPAPNALRGAFVRNTTTGARAMVTGNSVAGALLTCTLNLPLTVAAGNGFAIERPGSIIQLPAANGATMQGPGFVGFSNVKFTDLGAPPAPPFVTLISFVQNASAVMVGCEADMGVSGRAIVLNDKGQLSSGAFASPWAFEGAGNPFPASASAAGLYAHSTAFLSGFVNVNNFSNLSGNMLWDGVATFVQNGGEAVIGDFQGNGSVLAGVNSPLLQVATGKMVGGGFPYGAPVIGIQSFLRLGGTATAGGTPSATPLDVGGSAPGTPGVQLSQTVCQTLRLTGAANASYGIQVTRSSNVIRHALTTITGALGDVQIGAVVRAYAQLPFSETEIESLSTGAAAAIGATNNVTGLTGMTAADVGNLITIAGSATPANNDTHLIIKVVSANEVVVASVLVVDAGPVSWTLKSQRPTMNRVN